MSWSDRDLRRALKKLNSISDRIGRDSEHTQLASSAAATLDYELERALKKSHFCTEEKSHRFVSQFTHCFCRPSCTT